MPVSMASACLLNVHNVKTPSVTAIYDDQRLVDAAREGDRAAFGELYKRYCRMVHGILLARVPPSEAADLVQEVFLTALRKLETLRAANAFGGWLAMIARNRAVDYYRRAEDTEEISEEIPASNRPSAEAAEALEIIRLLPGTYRETLIMRLVQGMTGPEIAAVTGLAPASVRVNLHRGMKLLRERLSCRNTGRGEKRMDRHTKEGTLTPGETRSALLPEEGKRP